MLTTITFLLPISGLSALLTMSLQRKHLLMALLALEAMILSMVTAIAIMMSKNNTSDISTMLVLLTFGACEASLGLACLINLVRFKGNDMIKSTTSTKC